MLVVKVTKVNGSRCLNLEGELDMETLAMVEQAAEARDGECQLIINLAGVLFIDSTGLRGLLTIQRRWLAKGGAVYLINPSLEVAEVFRLVGLEELLQGTRAEIVKAGED
ncbi:STAS domain-containing protein [Moorella naiadis]|uniref:STAS domain-containing protein n=1 Tax=Moorella naiadis (nom. illeg.) TaxID=3093670 RepID=UPI003D9C98FE